jgi:arylsulfatase A-like enzyme
MQDLDQRGLLDETLVVMMGEMGRTPKINENGGRDHWTFCYSVLMAGAGIRGGTVYGASDAHAAFIKDKPVHIRDICATIYHCLGIDPEMTVLDQGQRPVPIAHGGQALTEILV